MKHFVSGRGVRALALLAALTGFVASVPVQAQALSSLMYFNGSRPLGSVVFGADGALYGVASESQVGGGAVAGLLYRVTTDASQVSTLYQYGRLGNYTGGGPRATLTRDASGNLYGVTAYTAIDATIGIAVGSGTVFKITQSGTYTRLHAFGDYTTTTAPFLNPDGAAPGGTLLLASDGFLYGTTIGGGANGTGTIYKVATDGTGFVSLHSFEASSTTNSDTRPINADGAQPQTRLLVASNGDLYGTTPMGGPNGTGTIFRMHRDGTGFVIVKILDASPDIDTSTGTLKTNTTGSYPGGGLVEANNGFLYGTTNTHGATGFGNIYRIALNGSNFTVMKDFDLTTGIAPLGELIIANDGTLVGTTTGGATQSNGVGGAGTLFSMTLDGTAYATSYVFGADGGSPGAGVVQGSDGAFYGTTSAGSPYGLGTVYKFGLATNKPAQGTPAPFDDGGAFSWQLALALGMLLAARSFLARQGVSAR